MKRTWTGSPFPTNESAWIVVVTGSQSPMRSGPYYYHDTQRRKQAGNRMWWGIGNAIGISCLHVILVPLPPWLSVYVSRCNRWWQFTYVFLARLKVHKWMLDSATTTTSKSVIDWVAHMYCLKPMHRVGKDNDDEWILCQHFSMIVHHISCT